jgi:hypothetical protein
VVLFSERPLSLQVLSKWLSLSEIVSSLLVLLSRKKLCRASQEWQECAIQALTILTSKSILDLASDPGVMDDIIVKGIPLVFLMRNGNEFGGRVVEVLGSSALAKRHPVLKGLSKMSREKGEEGGRNRERMRQTRLGKYTACS